MTENTQPHLKVKKYDWVVIEQDYVTSQGKPSLRSLEEKYGCSHATIERHALKGDWFKKREDHWAKVSTNAVQKSVESQSERLARHLKFAKYAEQKCLEAISQGKMRFSLKDFREFILLERMLYGETAYTEASQRKAESQISQEEAEVMLRALAELEDRKRKQVA